MHILLVEDDATCREIVGAALRVHGHHVTSVSCGAEAVDLLEVGLKPDLLLTDIQLPGDLDGWLLARHFKEEMPELPVVYMTGRRRDNDQVTNSIYLLKPVRPSLLMDVIGAIGPADPYRSATRVLH